MSRAITYVCRNASRRAEVTVESLGNDRYRVIFDGREHVVDWIPAQTRRAVSLIVDERYQHELVSHREGPERRYMVLGPEAFTVDCVEALVDAARSTTIAKSAAAGEEIVAPIPGKVVAIKVAVGDAVQAGATVVVLEAMKMQNELKCSGAGIVTAIHCQPGQPVDGGDLLLTLGPATSEAAS